MAGTPQKLAVLMGEKIEHPKIYLSKIAVWLLSTWVGTFIMCGRKSLSRKFPYFQRFSRVSSDKRRQILISWSQSTLFLLKLFYTATKIFALLTFFSQVNEKEENISWKAIGYSRPNVNNEEKSSEKLEQFEVEPLSSGVIELSRCGDEAVRKLQKIGIPVSTNTSTKPSLVIKCDVVVVGSGAGGGVVAGVVAKAGYKVVVLEKGKYVSRNKLSLVEGETMDEMYHQHGVSATQNMDILLLAGSTVGGGTTINWSASIPTPPHVIREWSEEHKLEFFDSKIYHKALDVVCDRMGVQSDFDKEGFNNMILRKGCEKLRYPVQNIPRNAPSDHYCGWCSLGCRDGKKKGVTETWLLDLVESGNGAILPQCKATKVIVQPAAGKKRGAAGGVAFTFEHGTETETGIVEARVTVVACGAICTPPLLKRSGLKNPNIGKNLHLHPVVLGWGYFPEGEGSWPEAERRSYQGGIMTAMSNHVVEETIIQTPSLHPGMFSALMPWVSGRDIKRRLLKYSRTAHIFALARDRGSGVVRSESDVSYKMEESDRENLRKGMERVLRILAAAGAEEIGSQEREGRVLRVKEASEEELERFVKEESQRPLEKVLSSPICSAHQMGSCRMGVHPKDSAVTPKGETWEVEGLYVADSSVFPTALGVNPMVTIQAIAYCTAQSILQALHNNSSI
ncbi:Long-chain fatty alcohol dehydrogenase family protein [Perilla frutescens var. frutescens]|nr:Long-chain fatty alcohol dehydrogenase family protein [Perilla frutescens var. frutescens]